MTVARLRRYALFLAGFEYSIEYKNTTQHGNADGLSRLPLKKACDKEVVDPVEIFQVSQIEVLCDDSFSLANWKTDSSRTAQ